MQKFGSLSGWRLFLKEMLPIVIGVLLAFLINSFGETYRVHRKVEKVQRLIISELQSNMEEAFKTVDVQKAKLAFFDIDIDSLLSSKDVKPSFSNLKSGGFRMTSLNNSAWHAANGSNVISEFNFEDLQMLTEIYLLQDMLQQFTPQIQETVFHSDYYNPGLTRVVFDNVKFMSLAYININEQYALKVKAYLVKKQTWR
ncbi:hypothetical protein DSECCO2_87320 [anaerobic digester metagenome]